MQTLHHAPKVGLIAVLSLAACGDPKPENSTAPSSGKAAKSTTAPGVKTAKPEMPPLKFSEIASDKDTLRSQLKRMDVELEHNPEGAYRHYLRGMICSKLENHEEAAASYERAVMLGLEDANLFVSQGHALRAIEQYEPSLAAYDKALAIKSDNQYAQYNRGLVLLELGRDADAVGALEKVESKFPDHVGLRLRLAGALRKLQRYDDAIGAYDRALKIDSGHVAATFGRGETLALSNKHEEALTVYDKVLEMDPDHWIVQVRRGDSLAALSRNDEAMAAYETTVSAERKRPGAQAEAQWGMALINMKEDKGKEALDCLTRCVDLSPRIYGAKIQQDPAFAALREHPELGPELTKLVEGK